MFNFVFRETPPQPRFQKHSIQAEKITSQTRSSKRTSKLTGKTSLLSSRVDQTKIGVRGHHGGHAVGVVEQVAPDQGRKNLEMTHKDELKLENDILKLKSREDFDPFWFKIKKG